MYNYWFELQMLGTEYLLPQRYCTPFSIVYSLSCTSFMSLQLKAFPEVMQFLRIRLCKF